MFREIKFYYIVTVFLNVGFLTDVYKVLMFYHFNSF
jgi:hypothetical protein